VAGRAKPITNHPEETMWFFLSSTLLLVIGLPLGLFLAGYGDIYLDYGPLISAVVLMVMLMLDLKSGPGNR